MAVSVRRHAACSYVGMLGRRITDAKRNDRSVARRRAAIALIGAAIGAIACGGSELDPDAPPLLTIAECREVGGAPLFDPADERPRAASCPEGLGFLGVFEEPFFGSDGGICCGGLDSTEWDVAAESDVAAQPDVTAESDAAAQPDVAAESDVTAQPDATAESDAAAQPEEIAEADAGAAPRK